MILIIDNYDSFTYNIYQYLGELYGDIKVVRNDEITLEEIRNLNPSAIVFSPGPGTPEETGICREILDNFKGSVPILGICIGHQLIGEYFGGQVIRAEKIYHGEVSTIKHNSKDLFKNLEDNIEVMRYHSLILKRDSIPKSLEITAETLDGVVMGLKHKNYKIYGVQFHPESILTSSGKTILKNFIEVI